MLSASVALRIPEAQTWFSVSVVRLKGNPAWKFACLEGIWPTPACTTMPKIECCISPFSTPDLAIASRIAAPPQLRRAQRQESPAELCERRPRRPEYYCPLHRCSSDTRTYCHQFIGRHYSRTRRKAQGSLEL